MAAIKHQHARTVRHERSKAALYTSRIGEGEVDCKIACVGRHLVLLGFISAVTPR